MLLNIVYCTRRGRRWRRIKGIGSSQGLSPSKFKTGVRNKCLTPVNSPLILIPITATIRTIFKSTVITKKICRVLIVAVMGIRIKGELTGVRNLFLTPVLNFEGERLQARAGPSLQLL